MGFPGNRGYMGQTGYVVYTTLTVGVNFYRHH